MAVRVEQENYINNRANFTVIEGGKGNFQSNDSKSEFDGCLMEPGKVIDFQAYKEKKEKKMLSYDPSFDAADLSRRLSDITDLEEYRKKREEFDAYTKRQLETLLGERFNVVLSTTRYEIKDGQIYGENTNEPFMQMLERGRDYRRKHGNPIDWEREQAEVDGIKKAQDDFCSGDAIPGDIDIVVSHRGKKGSTYQHNFYDIFTLKEDERGRYIEARRYSSALSLEEYAQKVRQLVPSHPLPLKLNDAYFLANPIKINAESKITADDIHRFFHKEHDFISKEELDGVLMDCQPFILKYTRILHENPYDEKKRFYAINAILNKADEVKKELKNGGIKRRDDTGFINRAAIASMAEIYRLGSQQVRQVTTGCGFSGGFTVFGNSPTGSLMYAANGFVSSPYSVVEYASSYVDYSVTSLGKEKILKCTCPFCKEKVGAIIARGKITCPKPSCGKSAKYTC